MIMFTTLENPIGKIGAKAKNLSRIAALDTDLFIIPRSLILTTSVFNQLKTKEKVDIPKNLTNEILKRVRLRFRDKRVVVRSSATCEDSILFSAAGQYDSFLNLKTSKEIVSAIGKVYQSFSTRNAKLYAAINHVDFDKEGMAVLIQEMAPVISSGVMFTANPITGNREFIIEQAKGIGVNVVSGKGRVDRIVIKNKKEVKSNDLLYKLVRIGTKIENLFKIPQDIEWGWDGERVFIFQSRPITPCAYPEKDNKKICAKPGDITGTTVSRGIEIGYLKDFNKPAGSLNNSILVQKRPLSSKNISQIAHSLGFILTTGGYLSHFSNIIRELGKPGILINIKNATTNSFIGKLVVLDGFNACCYLWQDLTFEERCNYFERFMELQVIKNRSAIDVYLGVKDVREKVLSKRDAATGNEIKKALSFDFPDRCLKKHNIFIDICQFNSAVWINFSKNLNKKSYKEIRIYFDKISRAISFLSAHGLVRGNSSTKLAI